MIKLLVCKLLITYSEHYLSLFYLPPWAWYFLISLPEPTRPVGCGSTRASLQGSIPAHNGCLETYKFRTENNWQYMRTSHFIFCFLDHHQFIFYYLLLCFLSRHTSRCLPKPTDTKWLHPVLGWFWSCHQYWLCACPAARERCGCHHISELLMGPRTHPQGKQKKEELIWEETKCFLNVYLNVYTINIDFTLWACLIYQVLETTAAFCKDHDIPFPNVDFASLEKEPQKEVYIFEDQENVKAPIVVHLPLVNVTYKHFKHPGMSILRGWISL